MEGCSAYRQGCRGGGFLKSFKAPGTSVPPLGHAIIAALLAPAPPGICVEFHAGYTGLEALWGSWNDTLQRKARPRFFQEWGWYEAYLKHLAPDPEKVCFALLTRRARPMAIVPLQQVGIAFHGLNSKLWRLPEDAQLPLADVIALDGVSGQDLVASLLNGMQVRNMHWDRVQFTGFGEDSCLQDLVATPALVGGWDVLSTCDEVICDLPWSTFAGRFSPNFRSNLNKARHKIERAGGASYQIANAPEDIAALFPEFLQVEASGWKGLSGARTAVALAPRRIGFYRSLIENFGPSGRIYINTMRLAGRVIAAQFCIAESDRIYVLKQGYDESYAQLAPGNSLLEQLVCWCYETRQFRAINQAGRPQWFQDWNPVHATNIYRLQLFNRTVVGQIHRVKYAAHVGLRALRG